MNIQDTAQAMQRTRVMRVWAEPQYQEGIVSMGGDFRGRFLILGDDESIRDFISQVKDCMPSRYPDYAYSSIAAG